MSDMVALLPAGYFKILIKLMVNADQLVDL
jgi:hypothetical protein